MSEASTAPVLEEDPKASKPKRGRSRGQKGAGAAPADSGRVLGVTGSNRTEIPVTSFDFLAGAYGLTARARRAMYAVIGVLGLLLAYMLVSVVSTAATASSMESEAEQWKQREAQVIASFGQAAGINVDQRLAIERRKALEESLVTIASGQFDMEAALAEVNSVVVPGASAVEFRAGFLASSADDLTTLDPAKGAPVEVLGESDGYLPGVEWAAGVAALPGFYDGQGIPDGATTVLVTAYLPLGTPPAVLVQRLADQGIVYVAPKAPVQVTAPESAKKKSAEDAASDAASSEAPE